MEEAGRQPARSPGVTATVGFTVGSGSLRNAGERQDWQRNLPQDRLSQQIHIRVICDSVLIKAGEHGRLAGQACDTGDVIEVADQVQHRGSAVAVEVAQARGLAYPLETRQGEKELDGQKG